MAQPNKLPVFLLRITLGWLFFWSGIKHVLDPEFSAAGYLSGAKALTGFYHWLSSPGILPITNALNEWGLTLIGLSLILGIGVRLAGRLGALMMILYWIPLGSFTVNNHIVYAASLLVLSSLRAGRVWGLESWCSGLPICSRFPRLRWWIG